MRFLCNTVEFSEALQKVSHALPTRAVDPVFEGIKIEAKSNFIKLTATDGNFSIETKVLGDVKFEGSVVVPGRFFNEIIRKVTAEQIDVSLNKENKVDVRFLNGNVSSHILNGANYPEITRPAAEHTLKIKEKDLKNVINSVIFCASTEENDSRKFLRGCLFEVCDGFLKLVAIDGYKLGLAKTVCANENDKFSGVAVAKNISEAVKLFGDGDKIITLEFGGKKLIIDGEYFIVNCALINTDFFDYKRVTSFEAKTLVTVQKKLLEDALSRAIIMSRDDKNYQVVLDISGHNIALKANGTAGEINENIPVSQRGADITIAYNPKFLLDCVKAAAGDYIKINLVSSEQAATIEPADGDAYLYLVIPKRIGK